MGGIALFQGETALQVVLLKLSKARYAQRPF